MRNEGTDADHMRVEFVQEREVRRHRFGRLPWCAYQKSTPHLKADITQGEQAGLALLEAHGCRMKLAIVARIGCFMAQKIPICPRVEELLVDLARQFARRDRDRAIGKARAQCADDIYERNLRVFPALQNERAIAQVVALFATSKDLFGTQAIAAQMRIGCSDPTVIAIVLAIVRVFNEATQKYLAAIVLVAHRTCALEQIRSQRQIVLYGKERNPFFALERLLRLELFDQSHRVVCARFRYASFVRHQASDYTLPCLFLMVNHGMLNSD